MKKLIAILIISSILLTSFSVVATTEGGYTHLSVGSAANSKLFLSLGEFDTAPINFIDYMAFGTTNGKSDLTDASIYEPQALFYTRDKSKEKSTVLYLGQDNIWNVNGFDFVLEPDKKIIKISRNSSVNLTDKELQDKVKGLEKVIVDVQDGYYKNLHLLICQPSSDPGNLNVTVEYDDLSTESTTISVMPKPYNETSTSYGYIVTRAANGDDKQAARRFNRYIVPCSENKAVTRITYSTTATWRHFYIISQMAENSSLEIHKADVQKHINMVAKSDENNIQLSEAISYVKVEKILNILKNQYNFTDTEFENYNRYLSVSSKFEERLKSRVVFDIFVSVDGSNNADGSIENPFSSVEDARDLIEEAFIYDINKAPFNVNLRGGEYRLTKTIELNNNYSGTIEAPITYKAYNGEKVVFTTADKINISQFKKITDKDLDLSIIEKQENDYKVTGVTVDANNKKIIDFMNTDKASDIFFWNLETLHPYSNIKKFE